MGRAGRCTLKRRMLWLPARVTPAHRGPGPEPARIDEINEDVFHERVSFPNQKAAQRLGIDRCACLRRSRIGLLVGAGRWLDCDGSWAF
jgi:hypothetical protein